MADHDELEAAAEADAERDFAEELKASSAERPDQEDGESLEDYVERLRNLQVAETRTDR